MTAQEALVTLSQLKSTLAQRGWLRATSGNLSLLLEDGRIAITASGTNKQENHPDDVLFVRPDGRKADQSPGRPSAETGVHLAIYRVTKARAVIHVHTIFNNSVGLQQDALEVTDHEMLKALGHWEESARVSIPVIPNYADLTRLAEEAGQRLDPSVPGILIRRHGVYAWGDDSPAALRHLEALEFLFEWSYYQALHRLVAQSSALPSAQMA